MAWFRAGNPPAAVSALQRAECLRADPDATGSLYLAMAHWRQGNREAAQRWYGEASRQKADSEDLRRLRAEAAGLLGPAPSR